MSKLPVISYQCSLNLSPQLAFVASATFFHRLILESLVLTRPQFPYCTLNDNAKAVLYNDLSPEQATYWLSQCQQHTLASFSKPVEFVAPDLKIPSMYLIAENDGAMSLPLQESLIAATPRMEVMRFSGGHSPFLSDPNFMVGAIVRAAKDLGSEKKD